MAKSTDKSVDKIVSAKQLTALIKMADQTKKRMQSDAGTLGEKIKNACDNGNLHRGVFSMIVKLYRMDELKREDFLRQFPIYVEMCRKAELFGVEHAGNLVDQMEGEEGEGAEPDQGEDGEKGEGDEGDGAEPDAGPSDNIVSLKDANAKLLEQGLKPLKPRKRKGGGLEGADAPSGTTFQ